MDNIEHSISIELDWPEENVVDWINTNVLGTKHAYFNSLTAIRVTDVRRTAQGRMRLNVTYGRVYKEPIHDLIDLVKICMQE